MHSYAISRYIGKHDNLFAPGFFFSPAFYTVDIFGVRGFRVNCIYNVRSTLLDRFEPAEFSKTKSQRVGRGSIYVASP